MTDEPSSGPPRVPVTAEFLAEAARKQAAYVESRRRYRAGFMRHSEDDPDELDAAEPVPTGIPAERPRRRSRGRSLDPRQLRFEV